MSSTSVHRMDWKFDMIDLPPESVIRGIIHLPGMDQRKLEMIAEALPAFFPPPLPRIDPVPALEEEYLPRRPQPIMAHMPEHRDFKMTFKRPLDEDQYFYPPPLRRVVEYDPYRPAVPFDIYQADAGAGLYAEKVSNGRVVYVDRGQAERPYTFERRPFPRPHAETVRYPARGGVDDGTYPHIIREVLDDQASDPRFRHDLAASSGSHETRGRLMSPDEDQRESYQGHGDGPNAAQRFLDNFESNNSRLYPGEDGPIYSR